MKVFLIRFLSSICLATVLVGCATVGETGRRQLMLVSPEQEMQLGLTSFEQMKQELKVSRDPQVNAMLQRVGQRIAAVAELPNAQWEFVAFESNEPNAFCLPGGKVGIYTGILPITQTEEGLATVIGHEVAHAAAHHGAERMSEAMALGLGGQLVGAAAGTFVPEYQQMAGLVYGAGATLGRALPHSRRQELEADKIGLFYMARAGYNPEAAIGFWERFATAAAGGGTPWFLRTHPVDSTRIAQLRELMPEAKAQYVGGGAGASTPVQGTEVIGRPR
ncbi:MAG: M48 family metallopeptidase [Verrucomicrobia bacterium]|nr:M48 family metallopeptidase [Verrucomicrobiota bacterium]